MLCQDTRYKFRLLERKAACLSQFRVDAIKNGIFLSEGHRRRAANILDESDEFHHGRTLDREEENIGLFRE